MTAPWNGLPDQPEHSGHHWLALKKEPDVWELHFWDQKFEVWGRYSCSLPQSKAKKYIYGEPARDPSELAQMRKDERERVITDALPKILIDLAELPDRTSPENVPDLLMATAHEVEVIVQEHIRNLPDEEGKKS